jgi:acyl-homoserine lactone acylase PvdQ
MAAIDGPGYDQSREFVPSSATEAQLAAQYGLVRKLGKRGTQMIKEVDAYTAGLNAYLRASKAGYPPWTRNDTVAAAAVLAGQYGVGGGDETRRAELLAELEVSLGATEGRRVWNDLREQQDPETPVTASQPFEYGHNTSEAGNVIPDVGSVGLSVERAGAATEARQRSMSNALVVSAKRSATGHPIYVAGPQVGYFYPGFFLEIDLHGGGFDSRGVSFPGVPWIVIGRGPDYAWSATTSHSDIVDQYVETLCGDDTHYLYKGTCIAMGSFDAGVVKGPPDHLVSFRTTVHGPVLGYATVQGQKVAISTKRATRGREILSALAFDNLDKARVHGPKDFILTMNKVEFGFNWTYADDRDIAYFSSGRLPVRPASVDLGLPTNGNGDFEWRGFVPLEGHAQAIDPPGGVLVNWNNKPARGYAAADDHWAYGSLQRVQLLSSKLAAKKKHTPASVVAAMNASATEDFRGLELVPDLSALLAGTTPPRAVDAQLLQLLQAWRQAGASRLDANGDGRIDDPGAAIMDAAWPKIARAVMTPVLGPLVAKLEKVQPLDDPANNQGSAYDDGWYGYVDKDLRALLGKPVAGRFSRQYCGAGVLAVCQASVWAAIDAAATELTASQGASPSAWHADANPERIHFSGGLLPATMRWTNRPTFQQVMSFSSHRRR